MKVLRGHDAAVAKFVADLFEQDPGAIFGACRALGVIDGEGMLVGGMVFHNWHPAAGVIEFSAAASSPKWLTRRILDELFGYAFREVPVQLLVTRNSAHNIRVHRQLARYGFDRFDIPRLFGRDEGGVIWTLTAEAFVTGAFNGRNVQEARRAHAA